MKPFRHICLFATLMLAILGSIFAQADKDSIQVKFSGYLESYYGVSPGARSAHNRNCFLVNYDRDKEFNINLALLQGELQGDGYRAKLGLMAGTYPQSNLAQEPVMLRNIYEATVGLSINKKRSLWADVGVFPSHLGFESPIGADNATMTRSLAAEGSPYYLSGAKLAWQINPRWSLNFLVINGWQRIRLPSHRTFPAIGHQLQYQSEKGSILNWSSFVAEGEPSRDIAKLLFNDFYAILPLHQRFSLVAGLDFGLAQANLSSRWDSWMVASLIGKYTIAKRWKLAARAEYLHDPASIAFGCLPIGSHPTFGNSLNLDFQARSKVLLRLEGRLFLDQDRMFTIPGGTSNSSFMLSSSISVKI
jgi:hypothetical protein